MPSEGSAWESLVAEAQFATELTIVGLQRLATVAIGTWGHNDLVDYEQSHALHVGLHSLTSGLERLAKIALMCHARTVTGEFVPVRNFSHHLDRMFAALAKLPFDAKKFRSAPLVRPTESLDTDMVGLLVRFASGPGRYENIDALSGSDSVANVALSWARLVAIAPPVSADIAICIHLRRAIIDNLRSVAEQNGLMSSAWKILFDLDEKPIDERSMKVVVQLYRIARWVASFVDSTTYYTSERTPILQEVVFRLGHSSVEFIQSEVLRIEDVELAIEEIDARRKSGFTSGECDEF